MPEFEEDNYALFMAAAITGLCVDFKVANAQTDAAKLVGAASIIAAHAVKDFNEHYPERHVIHPRR